MLRRHERPSPLKQNAEIICGQTEANLKGEAICGAAEEQGRADYHVWLVFEHDPQTTGR